MTLVVRHILALAALLGAACSPAPITPEVTAAPKPPTPEATQARTIDDVDLSQYSRELTKFTDLAEGQSRIAAIDVVRLLFAPEKGANIIKTSTEEFEMEGWNLILLSADGLADDSVRAQEFYLTLDVDENGVQTLGDYGARVKCWRGENTVNWQKDVCP